MEKINIKLLINNSSAPYLYEGVANEKGDIISFKNNIEEIIFDKKIERLTKINSKTTIIIDFFNKQLIIKSKERAFNVDIEVFKKESSDNKYHYIYQINEENIEFILEKEV